ncbi:MAG: hypothetical protein EHM45_09200 [Desulfobacteraceae bacterium]|nr:MAG: hypothetical protein EHM45_09200 [Desulfobacteraceae bacterium]
MKADNNKLSKLLSVWRRMYLSRATEAVGDQWQTEAMRRIRLIGPLNARTGFMELFEQMVWRLAPATSLMVVALVVVFLVSGLTQGNDVLAFMNDPEEMDLAQLLGFGG